MDSSGLQEMLELIYATNTVVHMLSGKAIAQVKLLNKLLNLHHRLFDHNLSLGDIKMLVTLRAI